MLAQPEIMPVKSFLAFVERSGSRWDAVCLDFDLAVQGDSYEDVIDKLRDQVKLFLDGVGDLPAADQVRLMSRKVPLRLRLRWLLSVAWSMLRRRPGRGPDEYLLVLPTGFAAA